jgi:hypothetical protein
MVTVSTIAALALPVVKASAENANPKIVFDVVI